MRVVISGSVVQDQDLYVYFSSDYGLASARWSLPAPPVPGEYDVEIELHDTFRHGHDLRTDQAMAPVLHEENGRIRIVGKVDSIEHGLVNLRLGQSLISVEVADWGQVPVGGTVEVTTHPSSVELFPYDL